MHTCILIHVASSTCVSANVLPALLIFLPLEHHTVGMRVQKYELSVKNRCSVLSISESKVNRGNSITISDRATNRFIQAANVTKLAILQQLS